MTYDGVPSSVAESGEIADRPDEDDITAVTVQDSAGEPAGLVVQWSNTEWFYAEGAESYESLDANL